MLVKYNIYTKMEKFLEHTKLQQENDVGWLFSYSSNTKGFLTSCTWKPTTVKTSCNIYIYERNLIRVTF